MTPQPKDSLYVLLVRIEGKVDQLVKADTDKEVRLRRLEDKRWLLLAVSVVAVIAGVPEAASLVGSV